MRGMRSLAASASAVKSGRHLWNSPIPYLFGGIALTLLLIITALIFLACSNRKPRRSASNSPPQDQDQNTNIHTPEITAADLQPKIVVIMAGNDTPTFLATPCCSSSDSSSSRSIEQFWKSGDCIVDFGSSIVFFSSSFYFWQRRERVNR